MDNELEVIPSGQVNGNNWREPKHHWRINVKTRDGIVLDNEDFVTGGFREAWQRAVTLGRRASYVPDAPNRKIYICVERWDDKRRTWVVIREKVGKVPDRFHHSQLAPR